ncbi:hypothetical protein GGR56DRAFT_677273 [Xylariaceae sp. FL0804]|nr:hypothetical protein GGR56DRAFT_677273 [Xylariaceae sp. FL0804]
MSGAHGFQQGPKPEHQDQQQHYQYHEHAQTPLLQGLGLVRLLQDHDTLTVQKGMITFMGLGHVDFEGWTHGHIEPRDGLPRGSCVPSCSYSVAPDHGVYIVHVICLWPPGPSSPPVRVRHRQLIADNYRHAVAANGGDGSAGFTSLATLRTIGYSAVVNPATLHAINAVLRDMGRHEDVEEVDEFEIEVRPRDRGWALLVEEGPFINGLIKLLEENVEEMGPRAIEKVTITNITDETNMMGEQPYGLYMVAHLTP